LDALDRKEPLAASEAVAADTFLKTVAKTESATDEPLLSFLAPRPPADLVIVVGPGVRTLLDLSAER
jgi:hypothetical protein